MTGDSSELLTEYVATLREFGLPEDDIRDLHADDDAPDDAPIEEFVARRVDASSREALFDRLVETLTQSRRGVSATASYWNYAPEVHLDEVFAPYGCSVTFRDAAHGGGGASIEIELEDAGGIGHRMRFEYPDTPLGDDNLPALLHAVENELLGDADLTFVLLTPIDRRWRVVLIESGRLAELERRRGERVQFAGRPLVREHQPPAFASGEASDVFPSAGETDSGTGRPSASAIANDRAVEVDDLLAGDGGTGLLDGGAAAADPDAVLDGSAADGFPDDPSPDGATGSGVEASDQELKRVFGDLSDVSLEPTAPADGAVDVRADDPPVLELGTGGDADEVSSGGDVAEATAGDRADDDPDALDGLFEELERTAVTDGDVGGSAGGGAMVVGAAESGASARSADRSRDRGADASADDAERARRSDAGGPADIADRAVDELLADVDGELDAGEAAVGRTDRAEEAAADEDDLAEQDAAGRDDTVASDESTGEFEWLSERELAERD